MGAPKKAQVFLSEEPSKDDDVSDVDDEQESELDSESEPDFPSKEPKEKENAIYNADGLLAKLEDIAWPENVEWIHKLTVDHDLPEQIDVNDDLTRELAFYNQAFDGTRHAFEKLQSMGLSFLRPPDYYAEMVKTDTHMLKVKGKLLEEKKKIEEADERQKAREAKKIAKEVHAEKVKERAKRKKEDIESVKKWRKQRQQSGFARGKDEDMAPNFDNERPFEGSKKRRPGVAPGDRSGGFARLGGKSRGGPEKNKKREFRESRFGHGGRKGMKKQNTAETTNDFRDFTKGGDKKRMKRV